jgi:hypothetical protein
VWANLSCPQPEAGAVGLRLNATLAQPLPPGGSWEQALANLVEVRGGAPIAPAGPLIGRARRCCPLDSTRPLHTRASRAG